MLVMYEISFLSFSTVLYDIRLYRQPNVLYRITKSGMCTPDGINVKNGLRGKEGPSRTEFF